MITHPLPIVVPVLNCRVLTQRAVASMLSQDTPVEVMLLDQGSTDGVREWALSEHRIASVVAFGRNIGVSAAWNVALRWWFDKRKSPAVLVCNNDVILRSDTARVLSTDGGAFVTAVSTDNPNAIGGEYVRAPRPNPDYSAWLMRREVWERVGEFDESMVVYCSDGDHHLRMHQAGIVAYTCGLPFYHYASGTLKNADREEKVAMQKQADADRRTFERKWGFKMGSSAYYAAFNAVAQVPPSASSAPPASTHCHTTA